MFRLFAQGRRRGRADRGDRGRRRSQEVREFLAGFNDAVIVTDSSGKDHPLDRKSVAGPDRSRGARPPIGPLGGRTRDPRDCGLGRDRGGFVACRHGVHATGSPDRLSGLADRELHHLLRAFRERVNTILALEIMGFAILLSGIFYLMNRKVTSRLNFLRRESEELRGAQRPPPARDRRAGARREEPRGRRADTPAKLEARDPRRDVGGGQPRAQPAPRGDEDLSCRRAPSVCSASGRTRRFLRSSASTT